MVQIPTKYYSFAEYLTYRDDTDFKYELVNGALIQMPPASGYHADIIDFLQQAFKAEISRLNLQWVVRPGTVGVRTTENKSRIPDLVVITESQRQAIRSLSSAVLESPPLLVVEVVSPNNREDDYRYKRSEYAVREIPEYWIVDPQESKVTVLILEAGLYEETVFTANCAIASPTFPELILTVEQVFSA